MARRAVASTVAETNTRVWKEFGEAMEKDFRMASTKFWQTASQEGKQGLAQTVLIQGGELLTQTGYFVKWWKEEPVWEPLNFISAFSR